MPKKKTPDENPKDQFKRFLETAREKGVDDATAKGAFKGLTASLRRKATERKSGPAGSGGQKT